MLYRHRRDSSMVEEGGQLGRRVVFAPSDVVERSFSGRIGAPKKYIISTPTY